MSVDVADAVAEAVAAWSEFHPVGVLWHGGEALVTGLARCARLAGWFGLGGGHRVRHGVQTNSVLWHVDLSGVDVFLCRLCRVNRYLEN